MEDRFRLEFNFHELFAIIYLDLFSKHLGHDDHVPQVSPDLFITGPEPGKEVLLTAAQASFNLATGAGWHHGEELADSHSLEFLDPETMIGELLTPPR